MLKMSLEENNFFEGIVTNSGISKEIVREVFLGMLKTFTIKFYGDEKIFYVPYICKLEASYSESITDKGILFKVNFDATACQAIIKEFKAIVEGENPPSKDLNKIGILEKFQNIVE